jgi:glucose uptake protein
LRREATVVVPHSYVIALLMTILTMSCWGSWANVVKIVKNWRFELLYFDYALGILLTSIAAGLTLGSMGSDGLPFFQDLAHAGTRNLLFGFLGGVVYNLSNILVVGAMAIAGLGVAFPIGVGLALVVGAVWNYFVNPQGNPVLLFGGVALVVTAIVLDGIAYRVHGIAKAAADPKLAARKSDQSARIRKGILLSVVGGVLMGMFFPLVEIGKKGEGGLGPYAIGFVFSVGVFLSTFVFNAWFLKRPVEGKPLRFRDYFRGTAFEHAAGIFGGVVWAIGTLSSFIAASAPRELQVGPAISYALGQGSTMVGAFWGVVVWKEFAGGGRLVGRLLALMFALFVIGLAVISIAPLFAPR